MLDLGDLLAAHAAAALRRPAAARRDWRAPSSASRACSCSTSRSPTSTPSCACETRLELRKLQTLARHHDGLRHARPGRGDDAGRPRRRLHGRPHRPGRHAARDLRPADHCRRRRLHRHAADEPAARRVGRARRHRRRLDAGGRRRIGEPARRDARRPPGRPAHRRRRPARRRRAHRGPRRHTIVNLVVDGRLVKLKSDEVEPVREGETVFVAFAPEDAHLFDAASGARLA